jgi:DNA repair exonuclease SbcCD ATPase subunit
LDDAQTAKYDLEIRCKELSSEQENSQRCSENFAGASDGLESELEGIRKLNSSLQEEIDGLNWKIQEFSETEEDLERLQSELFQSQAENGMLKKRLSVVEQEVRSRLHSETADEHSRLLNESSAKSSTIDDLRSQLSSVRSELLALKQMHDTAGVIKTDTAVQCAEDSDERHRPSRTMEATMADDELFQLRAAVAACQVEKEQLRLQLNNVLVEPDSSQSRIVRALLVDQSVQTMDMRNTAFSSRRKEVSY